MSVPISYRVKVCRSKRSFSTIEAAFEAGSRLMVLDAGVPLYVYPCLVCPGFHLTRNGEAASSVKVPGFVGSRSLLVFSQKDVHTGMTPKFGRRLRRSRKAGKATRERYEAGERHLSVIPLPRPASEAEVEDFFSRWAS